MAPVQSIEAFDVDSSPCVNEVCPRTLLQLVKSNEDGTMNAELGVSLDEVVAGCSEHRIHKGKVGWCFMRLWD